jgi:hypothetical protein
LIWFVYSYMGNDVTSYLIIFEILIWESHNYCLVYHSISNLRFFSGFRDYSVWNILTFSSSSSLGFISCVKPREGQALLEMVRKWIQCNAQMRTSLPSPSALSSLPSIDKVYAAETCPGRGTNSLLTLCECWPGYLYPFRWLIFFSFLFRFSLFSDLSTVCCVVTDVNRNRWDGPVSAVQVKHACFQISIILAVLHLNFSPAFPY